MLFFLALSIGLALGQYTLIVTARADGQGGGVPPSGPPAPSGHTLDDLYAFVASNGAVLPTPGSHTLVPSSAPGDADMHTVDEVLDLLRTRLPCQGGGSGVLPDTGQTKCYDQAGTVIACSGTGACPGQDGFYSTGCPPEGRFVNNGDGTVSDTCTGLMWQKDTAPGIHTWCGALTYCENLSFAGHDDWRLPNIRELQSIVDHSRFRPTMDPVFGAILACYWSSTSFPGGPGFAWDIFFFDGNVSNAIKGADRYVRAVRSGP